MVAEKILGWHEFAKVQRIIRALCGLGKQQTTEQITPCLMGGSDYHPPGRKLVNKNGRE
jgi:hypothetical protein